MPPSAAAEWIIVAALALGAFFFARRYGGGTALATLERSNRILTARVGELEASDLVKTKRIAELEASRDVAQVVEPLRQELRRHETAAEKRSKATLDVLQQIAGYLGPEAA